MRSYPTVLSIAGSDSSGGAGIQADIKSISANGGYAAAVITALTAQNTQGVFGIQGVSAEFVLAQLTAVLSDIAFDAIKIGMLYSRDIITVIADQLSGCQHIVLDPVMVATSGDQLMTDGMVSAMVSQLFPLVDLVTPNIPEAEVIVQARITSQEAMAAAARAIGDKYRVNVVIKGGHIEGDCADVLYQWEGGLVEWFVAPRCTTQNTHGTGCSLSSAIATYLARGCDLMESVKRAKNYLSKAIVSGADYCLGHGHGPINHFLNKTHYAD